MLSINRLLVTTIAAIYYSGVNFLLIIYGGKYCSIPVVSMTYLSLRWLQPIPLILFYLMIIELPGMYFSILVSKVITSLSFCIPFRDFPFCSRNKLVFFRF